MRRALSWGAAGLGVALLVAGTVVYRLGDTLPRGFVVHGASYQPLPLGRSWTVSWTAGQLVGAGLGVLGLLLLAGLGGRLLGGRLLGGRLLGRRAGRSQVLPWLVGGAAGALLVAGMVLFWLANTRPTTGGWYAYAPLSPADPAAYSSSFSISFDDEVLAWSGQHLLGALLAVLGLLLVVGLAGWLLGRRSAAGTGRSLR